MSSTKIPSRRVSTAGFSAANEEPDRSRRRRRLEPEAAQAVGAIHNDERPVERRRPGEQRRQRPRVPVAGWARDGDHAIVDVAVRIRELLSLLAERLFARAL